jgi:hypothetical protein
LKKTKRSIEKVEGRDSNNSRDEVVRKKKVNLSQSPERKISESSDPSMSIELQLANLFPRAQSITQLKSILSKIPRSSKRKVRKPKNRAQVQQAAEPAKGLNHAVNKVQEGGLTTPKRLKLNLLPSSNKRRNP